MRTMILSSLVLALAALHAPAFGQQFYKNRVFENLEKQKYFNMRGKQEFKTYEHKLKLDK